MKSSFKYFCASFIIVTSANAEPQKLSCDAGKVCLETEVAAGKYEYLLEKGSIVKLEVLSKHGAQVQVTSNNMTESVSKAQLGGNAEPKIEAAAKVGDNGVVAVQISQPNIKINGQTPESGPFKLKITKLKGNPKGVEI